MRDWWKRVKDLPVGALFQRPLAEFNGHSRDIYEFRSTFARGRRK
jgi:hypothetical protein